MNLKFRIQNGVQLKTSFMNKKKFSVSVGYLQPSEKSEVINFSCYTAGIIGMTAYAKKEGGTDNGN